MAYTELVKNFNRIREYMREFYVYGFKTREEFTGKSARSYDDERRRGESWLGDYMRFRQTSDGKVVFLSIDSRNSPHNPLYKAWKTKSFTDRDITLHFILLDMLASAENALSLHEIIERTDAYLTEYKTPLVLDESTVRKKLQEYISEGLIHAKKIGKTLYYERAEDLAFDDIDVLDYFSEIVPCGVIGSFLLDNKGAHKDHFRFKHHYITNALDSEITCLLFQAIHEKCEVTIETINSKKSGSSGQNVIPLQIWGSVQNGRQYLLVYFKRNKRIVAVRTDHIVSVEKGEVSTHFDELREKLEKMQTKMWGVSTQGNSGKRLEHVEFIISYAENEPHIHQRLEREKRCGTVERLDANRSRFTADVYDAAELVPWIRTFLCRIEEIHFSDPILEAQFKKDLEAMYQMYGLEGGEL